MAIILADGFDGLVGSSGYNRATAVFILSRAIDHLLDNMAPDLTAMILIRRKMRMIESEILSEKLAEHRNSQLIEPQFPYTGTVYRA